MRTLSIDVMLSRPGLHVVCTPAGVCVVEVEIGGRCWMLNLEDGSRNGELVEGRWILPNIIGILGPFVRAPALFPAFPKGQGLPWSRSAKM